MITGIQIIGIVFSLFMLYFSFLHFKRHEFNFYQFCVWEILWVGFLASVVFPGTLNLLTERLGISRAFDLFSLIAFMVVLALSFHNYVIISRLERKLEKQVRDEALEKIK